MKTIERAPLADEELQRIDRCWRAAKYLSVGRIDLLRNPLPDEPLADEHVKPRLLAHRGTTPGLNTLDAHCNRAIASRDLDMLFVTGPGHVVVVASREDLEAARQVREVVAAGTPLR